jgi:hypothetical protein
MKFSLIKIRTLDGKYEYINKEHIVRIYENELGIIIQVLNDHICTMETNMDILAEKISI